MVSLSWTNTIMAKYYDADGNHKTLYMLVRDDPGWATSIIKHMETEKASLLCEGTKLREALRQILECKHDDPSLLRMIADDALAR